MTSSAETDMSRPADRCAGAGETRRVGPTAAIRRVRGFSAVFADSDPYVPSVRSQSAAELDGAFVNQHSQPREQQVCCVANKG
jgi:hypothetical protein